MKPKILLIDDDEKLTRLLDRYLSDYGFQTSSAGTPSEGFKQIAKHAPDLIILDIMLPEMDGFAVCRTIRKTSNIPIIMLTARGDLTDRVVGLEIGADDYLPKPFEPRELVARITSVLRRGHGQQTRQKSTFAGLEIDHERRLALLHGRDLELTTNEFSVLSLLCSRPGRVYSRDEIFQEMRGIDCDAFNRTVDITVSRLRVKLGDDPKHPGFIKTVWGAGYAFIGSDSPST